MDAADRPTSPALLPGLHSPAAGFDAPFALLAACHERLERTLALLERLLEHLDSAGADAQARSAAADVWRYFEVAAPQHHLDEERHLLPALQASAQPALQAAAQQLLAEHAQLRQQWWGLGPALAALRDGDASTTATLRALAPPFIATHLAHLALENTLAWPAAQALLSDHAQAAMGADMARRRGVAHGPGR